MNLIEQIQSAEAQKQAALAQLHTQLGFDSPEALARAIETAAGGGMPAPSKRPENGNKRKGRRVPQATLDNIAASLKAGELGATLAAKYGVSYNIVHAVKTRLGMVTPSKRRKGRKRGA